MECLKIFHNPCQNGYKDIYIYIHTLYFGGDHTKYSILFFSKYRTGFWFPADILRFSGKGKAELAASN